MIQWKGAWTGVAIAREMAMSAPRIQTQIRCFIATLTSYASGQIARRGPCISSNAYAPGHARYSNCKADKSLGGQSETMGHSKRGTIVRTGTDGVREPT